MGDETELMEMRYDLAWAMQEGSDYSFDYCVTEIDRLTDTQIIAEWERSCENV